MVTLMTPAGRPPDLDAGDHTDASDHTDRPVAEPTSRFVLTVEDDGPGVPIQDRDKIFERFARLDQARGRDSGGAGLGLSLVMAIVEHHGGTITVDESSLGGARFTVTV
jgi:signal transduction histidine kinase